MHFSLAYGIHVTSISIATDSGSQEHFKKWLAYGSRSIDTKNDLDAKSTPNMST